jgi:prepilin-type N-terminal cleavage/methylation domain-containing protein/prepilin-type processing-associated H-X9-DG protein
MRHRSRYSGFTLIEILVCIAIMAILMSLLLPTLERVRHRAYITDCASNLRQVGQYIAQYENDNHGNFPRTVYVPGAPIVNGTGINAVDPFVAGGPSANDMTAAIFLLMRVQHIPPTILYCPYDDVLEFEADRADPQTHSNFTSYKKNLGYSFANPYPDAAAAAKGYRLTNRMGAEFALAADINPGIDAHDDVTVPNASSPFIVQRKAISDSHEKDGQNVLYGDGHVTWNKSVFCGLHGDNIYTNHNGQIDASPSDKEDSILLPTDD